MRGFPYPLSNHSQHAFQIRQHIIVPESERAEAIVREPAVALSIPHRFRVLTPVHLNNEPQIETEKICNVRPDRHLPSKLEILKRRSLSANQSFRCASVIRERRFRAVILRDAPSPASR